MILATFVGTMLAPHGYQYFRSIHGDGTLCETAFTTAICHYDVCKKYCVLEILTSAMTVWWSDNPSDTAKICIVRMTLENNSGN